MTRPHLFGPVSPAFAADHLDEPRTAGTCRTFGFEPGPAIDFVVQPSTTWAELVQGCPDSWRPDFLALWLPYEVVPPALWDAPAPIAGLATDWNLLWHSCQRIADRCDVLFTDPPGVAAFHAAGFDRARPVNLFGPGRPYRDHPWPAPDDPGRDIDVLFVGNVHPAIHRDRLPWLGRLARLADRYRVLIRCGAFGAEYRSLLGRAKVVFNRSVRGECNQRAFESALAGAVFIQERDNADVPTYFTPETEYRTYASDDLEAVIERLLADPAERCRVAEAARARVTHASFVSFWMAALDALDGDWSAIVERSMARAPWPSTERLRARAAVAVGATHPGRDTTLVGELELVAQAEPDDPSWQVASAAVATVQGTPVGELVARLDAAAGALALAARAEALDAARRPAEAVAAARAALAALNDSALGDPLFLPGGYTALRVEWERAAYGAASNSDNALVAKRELLRAHLQGLIALRTNDLDAFRLSAENPDFPRARAAFGCALALAGQSGDAIDHLRFAVTADPFDRSAARALFQAFLNVGDQAHADALAAEQRLLAQAAPGLVPREPWFAPAAPVRPATAPAAPATTRIVPLTATEFAARFGDPDTTRALIGFTNATDTHALLTLLTHHRPRRIVEIGTAAGHMTANLAEWSPDDATVYSLGDVADLAVGRGAAQAYETPPRAEFGRHADHFGSGSKVCLIAADSLHFDFARLAPIDFAFIDGAHDFANVLSDTRGLYAALDPGGILCWHDFGSAVPWVEVRQAIEAAGLTEPVHHVEGTEVAFLVKSATATPLTRATTDDAPLSIVWEGEVAAVHSLALANRAWAETLAARGHHVSVRPTRPLPGAPPADPGPAGRWIGRALRSPPVATVRHRYPPDFTTPSAGRLVVLQPWEFGVIPTAWVAGLQSANAEVWAPTRYGRDGFVESGVPADRVHVVPYELRQKTKEV